MLFILNRNLEVVDTLSNKGEITNITPYFDDEFKMYLETGAETFKFSTMANTRESQFLVVGNSIAFMYKKQYKLFTIVEIEEEHSEDFVKTVYCEMAGLEMINEILRPIDIKGASLRKFLDAILSDSKWSIGKVDIGLNKVIDVNIKGYSNIYKELQETVVGKFGGELSLTVELQGGRVVAKYINVYGTRGKDDGFLFSYTTNISSINRTVNYAPLCTALIGEGKDGLTFKSVEAEDKPLNQDFIVNPIAYERWSKDGEHIMGHEKFDTESAHELLKLSREKLIERSQPQVKYDLKTELLGADVEIGQTVRVVDHEFNPPIYLSARVNELTVSFTEPNNNNCVLGNYKDISTNITDEMRDIASQLEGYVDGKFPIAGDDIQEGAVGDREVSKEYKTQVIADSVTASLVETEKLVATKAEIEDLEAVKATIGELDVGVVIADELTAVKAEIGELEAGKASIGDLEAVKADITHLEADKIDVEEFNAEIAEINNAIIENAFITNAEIESLKAKDAEIENAVIENATITNAEIENLKVKDAEIENLVADKATIGDLDVTNANIEKLKVEVAEIDKAVIENATITNAEIESLKAKDAEIENLVADKADIEDLNATNATIENLKVEVAEIDKAVIDNAVITEAEIEKLKAKDVEIENAVIGKADIEDLNATNATIENLKVEVAEIDKAVIDKADITELNAVKATIGELEVEVAKIEQLEVEIADIDTLLAGNIDVENLVAGLIKADSALIENGAIGALQIGSVNANSINAGEIDTAKVKVKSTNGEVEISGYQILINDTTDMVNKKNRVILGKYTKTDGKEEYGLLVRGEDGNTVMIDYNGVHNAGITDGAVDNNKISDDAGIEGKKLEIESVVTSINGATTKIEGTSIVVDNKSLGVTISEMKDTQTEQGRELEQAQSDIQATSDKIDLSVSELTTKIIGENMFANSGLFMSDEHWVHNGGEGNSLTIKEDGWNGKPTFAFKFPNGLKGTGLNEHINLDKDTEYTYSAMIKSDVKIVGGETSPLHWWLKKSDKVTSANYAVTSGTQVDVEPNVWTHIQVTFKTNNTDDYTYFTPFIYKTSPQTNVEVAYLKLEKGKLATDWGVSSTANMSQIQLQKDEINLKVNADGVISAINMDSSGVAIQAEKIQLEGKVVIGSLSKDKDQFGGLFDKEDNQTVIEGGRIKTNSIKANKVDLKGLSVKQELVDGSEIETLAIDSSGSIAMKGELKSYDYDSVNNKGWYLSKDGDAILNNATVRGSVITPNAGITNDGASGNYNKLQIADVRARGTIEYKRTDLEIRLKSVTEYDGVYIYNLKNLTPLNEIHTLDFKAKKLSGVLNDFGGHVDTQYTLLKYFVDGKEYPVGHFTSGTTIETLNNSNWHDFRLVFKRTTDVDGDSSKDTNRLIPQPNRMEETMVEVLTKNWQIYKGEEIKEWSPNSADENKAVRFWAGKPYDEKTTAPFRVMQNGDIYAEQGTFKGTFAGKVEIGNIIITDSNGTQGNIKFTGEDKKIVLDITEDNIVLGRNTTIGTDSSNVEVTSTETIVTNKNFSVNKIVGDKTTTVVKIDKDNKQFMHLNGTHKLVTEGSKMIVEGNETEFSNNITVKNSITTNDMIVGNMQMKRRTESGNMGIDFIFV